jgi:hypothetical protein
MLAPLLASLAPLPAVVPAGHVTLQHAGDEGAASLATGPTFLRTATLSCSWLLKVGLRMGNRHRGGLAPTAHAHGGAKGKPKPCKAQAQAKAKAKAKVRPTTKVGCKPASQARGGKRTLTLQYKWLIHRAGKYSVQRKANAGWSQ